PRLPPVSMQRGSASDQRPAAVGSAARDAGAALAPAMRRDRLAIFAALAPGRIGETAQRLHLARGIATVAAPLRRAVIAERFALGRSGGVAGIVIEVLAELVAEIAAGERAQRGVGRSRSRPDLRRGRSCGSGRWLRRRWQRPAARGRTRAERNRGGDQRNWK